MIRPGPLPAVVNTYILAIQSTGNCMTKRPLIDAQPYACIRGWRSCIAQLQQIWVCPSEMQSTPSFVVRRETTILAGFPASLCSGLVPRMYMWKGSPKNDTPIWGLIANLECGSGSEAGILQFGPQILRHDRGMCQFCVPPKWPLNHLKKGRPQKQEGRM